MTTPDNRHAIEILLVEDSPTDRLIAVEALQQARILNSLNVVENGVEAMAYLRREGKYAAARRPDLILLDLNLPKKDGREVLREIKTDPVLKFIPVVVLTTSKAEEDVVRAYGHNANSYITKPVDFPRFTEVIRSIENYWFEIVTLPPEAMVLRVARADSTPARPHRLAVGQQVEVLLAEDNPADVLLIREALSNSALVKFTITHVERLSELRDRLRTRDFDIVLTDLGLPDSQGLDTYRQVRACAAGLPVIVLTGLDDEALGISALREGAQEYLVKGQLAEHSLARALRYAIERKSIEEKLRQAQKMEAVGQLSAGVAHDFNNLLTVIQGRTQLLMMRPGASPEKVAESLQEIHAAAERAATLTRQLLTFSRQQVMQTKSVQINEVVGNIGKMLRRIIGEEVRLELQLGTDLPAVEADVGMMEQVVLNLAINARDAMPGGGKLTVQSAFVEIAPAESKRHLDAYAGNFVCLTVSDTGCGMPADVLPRIFEPFFTTKDVGKGTGLGLATVFAIVQQHRGWIEVSSRVNAGTKFEIFLPASALKPAVVPPVAPTKPARGTELILVVEDEEQVRTLVTMMLEMQGYRVLEAGSGVEAVALWETHGAGIDLLFTDMIMPEGMSGRQLAEELHRRAPALRVIYTSGYSKDFIKADFVLNEGVNFLKKPYELASLVKTVRSRLDAP